MNHLQNPRRSSSNSRDEILKSAIQKLNDVSTLLLSIIMKEESPSVPQAVPQITGFTQQASQFPQYLSQPPKQVSQFPQYLSQLPEYNKPIHIQAIKPPYFREEKTTETVVEKNEPIQNEQIQQTIEKPKRKRGRPAKNTEQTRSVRKK